MAADDLAGWIAVGEVMGTFGRTGELRVKPLGRFPQRFRELRRVFIGPDRVPADVVHRRVYGDGVILRLKDITDREAARALHGAYLYVPESEAVTLPPGEYFVHQIVGLRALTTEGVELGTVRDVLHTRSNDVYVVHDGTREILVPAIKDVVKDIDLAAGTMVVELLPGLAGDEA